MSAVVGGVVAALTAWGVVAAGRRHDRRLAVEREARQAAFQLLLRLGEVRTELTSARSRESAVPALTEDRAGWGLPVIAAEVAMFSLDPRVGASFSQAVGRLRRRLEAVGNVAGPPPADVDRAVAACDEVTELLADWLMQGRHRRRTAGSERRLP